MGGPTRKQLVERWEDSCTPEMLVAPSPFGLVDGREDFRGFHWSCALNRYGLATKDFLRAGQVLDNVDLSYAEIHPFQARELTLSNSYAKQAKIIVQDWTYGSITSCEFDRCTIKGSMPWLKVSVAKCVFRSCKFPELFAYGTRYDQCHVTDMRLNGPVGGRSSNPVLTNVSVSGQWKECSFEETVEGDQLVGCDFSDVEFGACSFPYVDVRKVAVPENVRRYTVLNWESVHETIADQLAQLVESSLEGSEVYKQARLARSLLEMDDRGQHESAPRPRGARYCNELKAVADWGHSRNYLVELYVDAGAEFMIDPDFEELSGNGS
ncbi:hypothetical protein [Corynebacterium sp. Marseille-P3884]|uniref:hypothetical protein n=1 Tax=Corynebacterium sp. Marseille-P3884 TaxID=2495409 RepID=UPI001B344D37|nr:hypothetical protein [Corynebacterium sp. Marseille-P3884]MBP3948009.1 hypothetical protein [Corynebacterium sp. Marseille-P3884]